jgi:hypothetical protein
MTTRFFLRAFPVLLLLLPGTMVAAADDTLLARFVGDWTGRGTAKLAESADPERIFCRLSNTLIDDGKTLQQRGRCGVANNTGIVDGTIEALGNGRYAGTLRSLASRGAATVTGVASGGKLVLTAEFIDARTGDPAVSTTVLTPGNDGYRMSSTRTAPDGGDYAESDIVFGAR